MKVSAVRYARRRSLVVWRKREPSRRVRCGLFWQGKKEELFIKGRFVRKYTHGWSFDSKEKKKKEKRRTVQGRDDKKSYGATTTTFHVVGTRSIVTPPSERRNHHLHRYYHHRRATHEPWGSPWKSFPRVVLLSTQPASRESCMLNFQNQRGQSFGHEIEREKTR